LSEESLALFRELGSSWGIGRALESLARIASLQGETPGRPRCWMKALLYAANSETNEAR
jgi:hypothetical protein